MRMVKRKIHRLEANGKKKPVQCTRSDSNFENIYNVKKPLTCKCLFIRLPVQFVKTIIFNTRNENI
ncbi:hypothetical protein V1478_003835 [Vespula squamosa]|uniref:Uncharacterized protein n=1 Tax=Vespula squamosa TaxID=30214 RepID=A0ABD2BN07_VESSQ